MPLTILRIVLTTLSWTLFDVANNRGSSNFDQRHNLSISYVYGLPFFSAAAACLTNVLGGLADFQVSPWLKAGQPFSVTNGLGSFGDNAGVGNGVATAASHPDLLSDPKTGFTPKPRSKDARTALLQSKRPSRPRQDSLSAMSARNTLTLPGRLNFDFGLFKAFRQSTSGLGFEFRGGKRSTSSTTLSTAGNGSGASTGINAAFSAWQQLHAF